MKINNLFKRFGTKVIFNGESFNFENGKVTYILGESGIGKTTLLRIIAGLDGDFGGDFYEKSDRISYVFQEPRLFPHLSVEENIKIATASSPHSVEENINITTESSSYSVEEILKIAELENEAKALPTSLSGGMKMRVALARALYYNSDLVLMDEPFGALDEDLKARILPNVFEMLKDKTVIIVSHNLEEANKYAHKIINFNTDLK